MSVLQITSDGKTLYAVAVEQRRSRFHSWSGDVRYLHAKDLGEARIMFTAAHSQEIMGKLMKIIGIAPAVGFYVNDEHGDDLTA